MRNMEEVVARIKNPTSALGFDADALSSFVEYEHGKGLGLWSDEYCSKVDSGEIKHGSAPLTREAVLKEMREYMAFAWGKVIDHRGISANRSVEKMEAWVWLLGDDDVLKEMGGTEYSQYGAPILAAVCRRYGFGIPTGDEVQNVINGRPCRPGCESGCEL